MTTPTQTTWPRLRAQIPATASRIYMNSGWSGPLPQPVVDAVAQRFAREMQDGPTTRGVYRETMELRMDMREDVAALLGADVEEILLTQNTTEGINIVVNGIGWAPGDIVVTTSVEHGSGLVPAYYLRQRHGVELRVVETSATDAAAIVEEKFQTALRGGAKLVILSHISYSTGQLFPLAAIQRAAHAAGARVLVDGAQTMGHLPLDMHALDADYYAVPAHKWLLGPDGIGALFIRRELIANLEPAVVAGRAAQSYEYDGSAFVPAREAIEKFHLTTSSAPLGAGMAAAVAFYQEAGPAQAWDRIRALAQQAAHQLAQIDGVKILSSRQDDTRTGLVSFRLQGVTGSRMAEYLQVEYNVVCRGVSEVDGCRLSLHYFNTENEIAAAMAGVRAAAQHGVPDQILGKFPRPRPRGERSASA